MIGKSDQAFDRGNVDDGTGAASTHVRKCRLDTPNGTKVVGFEYELVLVDRGQLQRRGGPEAGVVDQHI